MNNYPYVPATEYGPQRTLLVLPAFTYDSVWLGVSRMVARYPVANTVPFSIERPIYHPTGDFVLAVSWAESPYVFRFKLDDIADTLAFPVYDGEKIGANAYIEVWSTLDGILAMDENFVLPISILQEPTCAGVTCENGTTSTVLVPSEFTSIPADQQCNPFCSPLCV